MKSNPLGEYMNVLVKCFIVAGIACAVMPLSAIGNQSDVMNTVLQSRLKSVDELSYEQARAESARLKKVNTEMDKIFRSMIHKPPYKDEVLSEVILKPEVHDEVKKISESINLQARHGGIFENMIISGRPGTGKTTLATRIARASGFEYISLHSPLLWAFNTEEASILLQKIFHYARTGSRPVVIIIEEVEGFLHNHAADLTEKQRTLLSLLLAYTATESRDEMVIFTTMDSAGDIDERILKICEKHIHLEVPDKNVRRAILSHYVNRVLLEAKNLKWPADSIFSWQYWFGSYKRIIPTIEEGALSNEALDALSERLDGFTGREIATLVYGIQNDALASEDMKITSALINKKVEEALGSDVHKKFDRPLDNRG